MGTSSLYKGPKKTVLLPSDYNPEEGLGESLPAAQPEGTDPDTETSEEGGQQPEALDNGVEQQPSQPGAGWSAARSGMTRAMNNRSPHNVRHAIRTYTKALGGHSNATRQATSARRTAGVIYTYFSGTPDTIRKRFEESGIQFDGRSTKDIFSDIFGGFGGCWAVGFRGTGGLQRFRRKLPARQRRQRGGAWPGRAYRRQYRPEEQRLVGGLV